MKIRTDFVTNSSSSSFILGGPGESYLTIKNAERYLHSIKSKLSLTEDVRCDYIIDLKYDPNKKYDVEEIQFVVETIIWYVEFGPDDIASDIIFDDEEDVAYIHDDAGNRVKLDEYSDHWTKSEIKAIFDYAHRHFGEILVGNSERGFYPDEAYYDEIDLNPDIKYSCNHMG